MGRGRRRRADDLLLNVLNMCERVRTQLGAVTLGPGWQWLKMIVYIQFAPSYEELPFDPSLTEDGTKILHQQSVDSWQYLHYTMSPSVVSNWPDSGCNEFLCIVVLRLSPWSECSLYSSGNFPGDWSLKADVSGFNVGPIVLGDQEWKTGWT